MRTRSEELEERRLRRNKIVIAVVIIVLMLFSSVASAVLFFTDGNSSIKYNGRKFKAAINDQGLIQGYTTKIEGKEVFFYSSPEAAASLEAPPGFSLTLQQANAIVFIFNPADPLVPIYDQIRFDLSQTIPKQQGAAILNSSPSYSLPVLSCANSSAAYPFILLMNGTKNVTYSEGCYVFSGTQYDFALLRDKIVYSYYGIA
jgi:hypothetical protein